MVKKDSTLKEAVEKTKEQAAEFTDTSKRKIDEHVIPVVISGFAFIVALVWRDFIRDIVTAWVQANNIQNTYVYSFVVAALVTLVAIVIVLIIAKKPEDHGDEKSP